MRICAKCGEEETEVAFIVEWRGQDVCSCCLDSEPDYWQHEAGLKDKRIAELAAEVKLLRSGGSGKNKTPIPDCECGHLWAHHSIGGGHCEMCGGCDDYKATGG